MTYHSDDCSLTKCIRKTSDKLKKALVTREAVNDDSHRTENRGKNRLRATRSYPENAEMKEAPNIFKETLKISCLTQHQLEVFNCNEQFLWVEGPAGSGKTIAMLGKMTHLALHTEKRCLLIIAGDTAATCHEEMFNKIQKNLCQIIVYQYINLEGDIANKLNTAYNSLQNQLSNSESKIVILVMYDTLVFQNTSSLLTIFDCIFVDDYQLLVDYMCYDSNQDSECAHNILTEGFLPIVQSTTTNNSTRVWVVCDGGQSWRDKYWRLFNL